MKKTLKIMMTLMVMAALAVALTACGGADDKDTEATDSETKTLGIIQFAPHPSLDNCYEGFVAGLEEGGYVDGENLKIDLQNSQGEATNSDMQAKNMVTSKYDMLCAIATPSAMSAYSATKDSDIPVIFTAVSDPLAAGIVKAMEKPETNCTGTSDSLNLDAQMAMIRAFLPEAKTIGIIYTTSEPNSVSNLAKFEELASKYDFTIESVGIATSSEVETAAASLIAKGVDCFNNFTDNNVVNNLSVLLHAADEAGIPVFGSEEEQVVNGCLASESLDYFELGRITGLMAAKVLNGEATPADLAVEVIADSKPVYNKAVADKLKLTLPEEYAEAADLSK